MTGSPANDRQPLKRWPLRAKVIVSLLIALLAVEGAAADRAGDRSTPDSSTSSAPTTTQLSTPGRKRTDRTPSTPPTGSALPANPASPGDDLALLRRLPVDDSARSRTGYIRDLFPTWLDLDGNGCDARQDTLIAESLVTATVIPGCDVVAGSWRSIYDGVEVSEPSTLDVDHLVPLGEAWKSGAYRWEAQRRAAYANDVSYPDHLIAVTAESNRAKSDSTPDEWRPPDRASWCRYATAWVEVKSDWILTVTTTERDALGQMLETC